LIVSKEGKKIINNPAAKQPLRRVFLSLNPNLLPNLQRFVLLDTIQFAKFVDGGAIALGNLGQRVAGTHLIIYGTPL